MDIFLNSEDKVSYQRTQRSDWSGQKKKEKVVLKSIMYMY